MKEKKIIATLENYNISDTSFEVGKKIGFEKIVSLIRKGKLYSEYNKECSEWILANPKIKEEMEKFEPIDSFFDKDDGGEKDAGLMANAIMFPDVLEIIEQHGRGKVPAMLSAVLEVASKDMDAWHLEDCTICGIGEDYLREIEEYLAFLDLVPTPC